MPDNIEHNHSPRFHADAIESTPDNPPRIYGHIHGSEGMPIDEVRESIAEQTGVDPADVHVFRGESAQKAAKQIFGFSNWSGSKWEPTGPKGNPNLN